MKFHLSNCITALVITMMFCGCDCHNPISVDDRFLEKDSLANYPIPSSFKSGFATDCSFLIVTDTHYGSTPYQFFKYIEDNQAAWGIDFIIHLGDITEAGTQAQLDLAKSDIAKTTLQVYPVIGNHDIFAGGFNNYKYAFGRTVYNFTVDGHSFIFLDSASGTLGSLQRSWLESVLSQTASGKNRFIFTHFPLSEAGFQEFLEFSYPKERYYLFDLFDRYDVNYYFAGHFHFNDDVEIRGVRFIVISDLLRGIRSGALLKVRINAGVITTTYL